MEHPVLIGDRWKPEHACQVAWSPAIMVPLIALIALQSLSAVDEHSAAASRRRVTFAQLTDAHIFGEGWKQPTAEALREAADDRTALDWAIQEINRLVSSGTRIDFVVFTGDLGLQNVD